MKNFATKSLASLMVILTLISIIPISSYAANVKYYQTTADNVPVWTEPASDKTSPTSKKKRVREKGTVLKVIGETTNSAGNRWYQIKGGYWVYCENVVKHTHNYVGGICKDNGCGYEYPLSLKNISVYIKVSNVNDAPVRSRPYENNSSILYYAKYDSILKVKAQVYNVNSNGERHNLWLQLENGNWIYSGNVKQCHIIKYDANGGKGAPSSQNFISGNTLTLSKTKPTRVGYAFKGWATSSSSTVSYKAGGSYSEKKSRTLYAVWGKCSHSYVGGICKTCNYEYPLKETNYSATFVVTEHSLSQMIKVLQFGINRILQAVVKK